MSEICRFLWLLRVNLQSCTNGLWDWWDGVSYILKKWPKYVFSNTKLTKGSKNQVVNLLDKIWNRYKMIKNQQILLIFGIYGLLWVSGLTTMCYVMYIVCNVMIGVNLLSQWPPYWKSLFIDRFWRNFVYRFYDGF